MEEKFRIGISSCILGNPVRWNAGHKLDKYLTNTLGQFVEYVPVCPEVEVGLGVPRESMRLVGAPESPRLITFKSKTDHTDKMVRWARKRVRELEKENLCGFIFKSDSPSSGMIRVKVYNDKGMPHKVGVGIFAREFIEPFPVHSGGRRWPAQQSADPGKFYSTTIHHEALAGHLYGKARHGQTGGIPYPQQAAAIVPQPKALPVDGQAGCPGQTTTHG